MDGPLFMTDQDMANLALVQFIIDIQENASRIAEDRVDPLLL
jgi:hypothetical protein